MGSAIEESQGDIVVTARCEGCRATTRHDLWFEQEGDVLVMLSCCAGCGLVLIQEGTDAA